MKSKKITKMDYRKERKRLGLSQSKVALAADISLMTYQLIERGVTKNPGKENLAAIKKCLSKDKKE